MNPRFPKIGWLSCVSGAALACAFALARPAAAQVALDGAFTAQKACPANKKLTSDNPGGVMTVIGERYRLVGKNRQDATHYLIVVPGAAVTERRWVDIACGTADTGMAGGSAPPGGAEIEPDTVENVLAASWQPAFCASSAGRGKIECETQTPDRPDATQFSIHGLWPDDLHDTRIFPCYCENGPPVSCRMTLDRVSGLDIAQPVRDKLDVLMPGTQSGLHLHEWTKHGSCYEDFISGDGVGADPDEYFSDTIRVIEQLNDSAVRDLFVARIGAEVTLDEIAATFEEAFGPGAGDRVIVNCTRIGGRNAISELWIGLGGEIGDDSDLGALIRAAPTTASSTTQASCRRGVVLAVE